MITPPHAINHGPVETGGSQILITQPNFLCLREYMRALQHNLKDAAHKGEELMLWTRKLRGSNVKHITETSHF
jgi:hypothetical protein